MDYPEDPLKLPQYYSFLQAQQLARFAEESCYDLILKGIEPEICADYTDPLNIRIIVRPRNT